MQTIKMLIKKIMDELYNREERDELESKVV